MAKAHSVKKPDTRRKRNYAEEQRKHALEQPEIQARIYQMMKDHIPEKDIALVGWQALSDYLESMGIKRPNAWQPVSRRMVYRWRREFGFPLLPAAWNGARCKAPLLSSAFAVSAWLLSQIHSGHSRLFAVSVSNMSKFEHLGVSYVCDKDGKGWRPVNPYSRRERVAVAA